MFDIINKIIDIAPEIISICAVSGAAVPANLIDKIGFLGKIFNVFAGNFGAAKNLK